MHVKPTLQPAHVKFVVLAHTLQIQPISVPTVQFVNYAHHAIAYALWEKKSIEGFIQFVDALMSKQGDEFMTVAKVTAKDVAQQVRDLLWS